MKSMARATLIIMLLTAAGFGQSFTFSADQLNHTDTTGHFFDIYADLINIGTETLNLRITRTRLELPPDPGWFNSLCNGLICYAPQIDTITIPDDFFGVPALEPDSSVEFHINVGTDPNVAGTGFVSVKVENLADTTEFIELDFEITTETPNSIEDLIGTAPESFALAQNFPNPFNPSTKIGYRVPLEGGNQAVSLVVYDQLGRKVRTLVSNSQGPGTYEVEWNGLDDQGSAVGSGIYFYQLTTADLSETRKMLLVR